MRAIVLLGLLHSPLVIDARNYTWNGLSGTTPKADPAINNVCLTEQASCGCCLIQKQIQRVKSHFDGNIDEMKKELTKSKMSLNDIRASRSAFSVALSTDTVFSCSGPFTNDKGIVYSHIFINLGGNYNVQTGVFTVPRSGVYSLTVTIYASVTSGNVATCANLKVNNKVVSVLSEQSGQDKEDSASVVVALPLKARDKVAVNLLKGCFVCDDNNHFNTFTGFLLYATN